jgi:glucokinase
MGDITIGIDIGGTKIQAAAIGGGEVIGAARVETPREGPEALAAAVSEAVHEALTDGFVQRADARSAGGGVPGSVDSSSGTVANSPNLVGFEGAEPVPLGPMISERLGGIDVRLDNDVRAAIVGECKRGAGRPYRNLLGVWVGTGVGGGLVLDGELYEGTRSAGEIGHVVVKPGGRMCSDERRGHLEAYAGRGRMEAQARKLRDEGRKTIVFDLMEKKGRTRLTSSVVAKALEKGDDVMTELVTDAVWALAHALASVQNLLALEAIVLGGGLADRLGQPFLERIRAEMEPLLFVPERAPTMVMSEFGDLSGAVGGAVLVGG